MKKFNILRKIEVQNTLLFFQKRSRYQNKVRDKKGFCEFVPFCGKSSGNIKGCRL